ncbi:MAG: hypothetical protein Q9168_008403 [Polycauliona sp. 1 TL-2023]
MPRVLISGAGIAGTVLAYWLAKHNFQIILIERSLSNTQAGQIIDVEGPTQEIVSRMGLMDQIKSNITHEAGIRFVDDSGSEYARVPAGQTVVGISNEIEIMRPALAGILLEAAEAWRGNVEVRYGCTVKGIRQLEKGVVVDVLDKGTGKVGQERVDFLVAADGLRSRTRDLIFPTSSSEEVGSCVQSLKVFAAFFSIPAEPQDRPWATIYQSTGRRTVFTKPWNETETSAYLTCAKYSNELHEARESRDVEKQKEAVKKVFEGLGWETERILKGMMETGNFYFEEISQVKLPKWSHGRCVCLGDTAYCPSPLTGQGTNLAILGAYVLASKLVDKDNTDDPVKAFEEYEHDFRPYVDKVQPIPLGGYLPFLINPDTSWGLWILRFVVGWVTWLQPWRVLPDMKNVAYQLPDF